MVKISMERGASAMGFDTSAQPFDTSGRTGLGCLPPARYCQLNAARSFAKIGELLHTPFRFFLDTANCGSWKR